MRFKLANKPAEDAPKVGDIRLREGFLWLPKVMRNIGADRREIRWLEKAHWYQEYRMRMMTIVGSRAVKATETGVWRNLKWCADRPTNPEFIGDSDGESYL